MHKKLRLVLAQLNLTVGDIQGNLTKLIDAAKMARDELSADVIIFPELCITGYPPEDLLLRKSFIDAATEAFYELKSQVTDIYCVISHPHPTAEGLQNACFVTYNDAIVGYYAKQHLPNYGVFDEQRYFVPGHSTCIVPIHGIPVGIIVCEDLWNPAPIQEAADAGARLILVPNASPFEVNKFSQRHNILANRAKTINLPIAYVNCVGEQDEIVFDGGSMVVDSQGNICQYAGICHEVLLPVEIEFTETEARVSSSQFTLPSTHTRIYECLKLGVKDYLAKNRFPGALVGVSGGVDSALTLAIAVDALGKDNVHAVLMPSRYTSEESMEDALALVKNLGVHHDIVSIEPMFKAFLQNLEPLFAGKKPDITEENLQSRCRGMILMALSNKTGKIVLTTGNRSEMAVGYATLYGDMAGGLAVLKDIPKLLVYELSYYRNQISPVIPENTLVRPPTAELAPNQKDEDSLPPYEILDAILGMYLNNMMGFEEIVAQGFDKGVVTKVINLINKSEYKRRQAAIGIRINHTAFGKDRRYPITSKFYQ